jgi:hypothetical protein
MRSLGAFFGHIARGIRTDVTAKTDGGANTSDVREVRRTVEEEETAEGVVLRRTIIEEVELRGPGVHAPRQAEHPRDSSGPTGGDATRE